jgi:DNA end-binding protein Ku
MRAIWNGSVGFGLVNIPVRLYSGSESRGGIDLNMLHKKDLSPIRYARICRSDGQEVPYEDIVKGYAYRKGDYIVLDEKDFEKANAKKTKTIEIVEFIDEKEIDVRYYEKPYYLEPDKGSAHAYSLLREALKQSGKVAIARFVMRSRENLAAIKPVGRALVLDQLRYPSDIRQPSELNLPEEEAVSEKEIDMALALINQLTQAFVPEDFHDTYTEELEKVIEAKARGKQLPAGEPAPQGTPVQDLMTQLKASLEKQKTQAS